MFNIPLTVQTKEPVTVIGPMIAALIVVANVLVVFTSIVFQFWKKLFAVVISPIVPALATVLQESVFTPSVLRYCPTVPVPAEILGSVTVPSAGDPAGTAVAMAIALGG